MEVPIKTHESLKLINPWKSHNKWKTCKKSQKCKPRNLAKIKHVRTSKRFFIFLFNFLIRVKRVRFFALYANKIEFNFKKLNIFNYKAYLIFKHFLATITINEKLPVVSGWAPQRCPIRGRACWPNKDQDDYDIFARGSEKGGNQFTEVHILQKKTEKNEFPQKS
jgi:hypothetical protein